MYKKIRNEARLAVKASDHARRKALRPKVEEAEFAFRKARAAEFLANVGVDGEPLDWVGLVPPGEYIVVKEFTPKSNRSGQWECDEDRQPLTVGSTVTVRGVRYGTMPLPFRGPAPVAFLETTVNGVECSSRFMQAKDPAIWIQRKI
jgi:hypothetical protein